MAFANKLGLMVGFNRLSVDKIAWQQWVNILTSLVMQENQWKSFASHCGYDFSKECYATQIIFRLNNTIRP